VPVFCLQCVDFHPCVFVEEVKREMRNWQKFQVSSECLEAEERFAFTNRVGRAIQSSVDLPSVSLSSVHSFSV
jgi:hypothetical protein